MQLTITAARDMHGLDKNQICWEKMISDYEIAIANAFKFVIRTLLPHINTRFEVEGCHMVITQLIITHNFIFYFNFYHLIQHMCCAIYKNLHKFGLSTNYMNNETFQKFISKLMALAFLPVAYIVPTYLNLKGCLPFQIKDDLRVIRFFAYFEKYWLNLTASTNSIALQVWSVYSRVHSTIRTNNHLEGKHLFYLHWFGIHKDLFTFIRKLIELQSVHEIEWLQFTYGGNPPRPMSRANQAKERCLNVLKMNFDASRKMINDCIEYVTAVSHRMRRYTLTTANLDITD